MRTECDFCGSNKDIKEIGYKSNVRKGLIMVGLCKECRKKEANNIRRYVCDTLLK